MARVVVSKSSSISDRIEAFEHALTADELAALLNVSRITVFRAAWKGIIPSFRIGTCLRFDPFVVSVWLRTRPSGAVGQSLR